MNVLLVEDDNTHADLITRRLGRGGELKVVRAPNGGSAIRALDDQRFGLVLLDYSLPDANGLEILRRIRGHDATLPVIFLTAADSAEICARAMRSGAVDYVLKKTNYLDRLQQAILDVFPGADTPTATGAVPSLGLVGASPGITKLRTAIVRAAASDATVLLEGETGTGKELVARAIHETSPRSARPFVAVNCAEVPESLFESEFFGSTRGAFTGAVADRTGLLESSRGGTLVLDEIEALALPHQAKLLRVLQNREFKPVGSSRFLRFDARVVAASNDDLESLVDRGVFRRDLFYRLYVLRVFVPPLRDRRSDVPHLVRHFVAQFNRRNGTRFQPPSEASMKELAAYGWPGNVRELEHLIERVLVNSGGDAVDEALLLGGIGKKGSERERILSALRENRWNRERTAETLGCSRVTLWRKMARYRIRP